jgi:hypothetical protein
MTTSARSPCAPPGCPNGRCERSGTWSKPLVQSSGCHRIDSLINFSLDCALTIYLSVVTHVSWGSAPSSHDEGSIACTTNQQETPRSGCWHATCPNRPPQRSDHGPREHCAPTSVRAVLPARRRPRNPGTARLPPVPGHSGMPGLRPDQPRRVRNLGGLAPEERKALSRILRSRATASKRPPRRGRPSQGAA